MDQDRFLTAREAKAVVDDCIERIGLGALPEVLASESADDKWRVRWDHRESISAPMTLASWQAWLEENVGSLDPGDLQTTES